VRLVEMEVKGLALDPSSNMPVVILKDPADGRVLPIWIGLFEANAIALKLEGVDPPRPLTHDLFGGILSALGARLASVEINDLSDGTYHALLHLFLDEAEVDVDSRPSDAIALALRAGAPILVRESVLDRAGGDEVIDGFHNDDRLREWLDNLRPEDFGGGSR
jgi:hypothetical protein